MTLSSLITDKNGQLAPMKITFLVWGIGSFVLYVYCLVTGKPMIAVPESIVTMTGVVSAGHVVKSAVDNKAAATSSSTTTTTSSVVTPVAPVVAPIP